jgi:hypothetical protein
MEAGTKGPMVKGFLIVSLQWNELSACEKVAFGPSHIDRAQYQQA